MSQTAQLVIQILEADADGRFARARVDEALALGVGGVVLRRGEVDAVRALTKELQRRARTPMLIGADMERGAGQQFVGAAGLPPLAALAWLDDVETLRRAARLTAREARTMGVNWALAPVCDLDVEPTRNPVLGARALGADPARVARLALDWIEACQAEGVLACAKHFPGGGRTVGRSDEELRAVAADRETLHATDLAPFRTVVERGVGSMMMANVAYPGLDPGGHPAAQSREIVQWLLRQQVRFEGLLVALAARTPGSRGTAASEEEAAVRAIAAGCDVVLAPTDARATVRAIDAALAARTLDPARVQESARRRLRWAQWVSPPNDWRRPSAADAAWGAQLAERVVHVTRGAPPALGAEVEMAVVDDDALDGTDVPSREPLVDALRAAGRDVRVVDAPGAGVGPFVVALYGEAQPGRRHVGYAPATLERVAALGTAAAGRGRPAVVVQFAHPRLLVELPGVRHAVCAWSGDRGMQQAAARWLGARS